MPRQSLAAPLASPPPFAPEGKETTVIDESLTMIPGPTPVHARILGALARPTTSHVFPAFVEEFRQALECLGVPTAAGRFGAHMVVSLVNDGPYTILLGD